MLFDDFSQDSQLILEHYEPIESSIKLVVRNRRGRKDPFRESKYSTDCPQSKKLVPPIFFLVLNNIFPNFQSQTCNVCQKVFSDKKKVKLHIQRVHKQIKDHKCNNCEYKAYTKFDILRHIKANHMTTSDPKDSRICPDCGKVLKVSILLVCL